MLVFLPGHRRDHPDRRAARRRRPDVDVHRLAGALEPRGAGPGAGAVAARPAARRAGHRHRRDVADRRRRRRRRRQRAGPGTALRRRHRDDPAHDGVDQPRLGRPARRPGRPRRARRGLPAVEPDGARHPPGPPRRRDHPGRPRRARARAGRVGHAGRTSCRSSTARRPRRGARRASCSAELGALDATGAITALGRRMLGLPGAPPPGPDDRRAAGHAVVRRRRARRRARHRPRPRDGVRPTWRCASSSVRAAATTGPTGGRRACASAPPTSPGAPASRFDLDAVDPDDAGAALLAGFPDRLAGRRRPGQFQLRTGVRRVGRRRRPAGDRAVRRRRRPRRQAIRRPHPPRRRGRRDRHRRRARRRRRGSPAGVGRGDDLVERVERRLDALRLGEERRRPPTG